MSRRKLSATSRKRLKQNVIMKGWESATRWVSVWKTMKQRHSNIILWLRAVAMVMSMYRTGLCYYNGVGVKQNYTEAYRWFNDAAGNDNVASYYYLGKMLMYGEGCVPDAEAGLQWLMKLLSIIVTRRSSNWAMPI